MQKKIIFLFLSAIISIIIVSAAAAHQESCMDKKSCKLTGIFYEKYFKLGFIKNTSVSFNIDRDIRHKIYMKTISFPSEGHYFIPHIYVKYYQEDNKEFKTYNDYIEANSKDIFGLTDNNLLSFDPVSEVKIKRKTAYIIGRKKYRFTDYHSKTSKGAWEKEKIYVIPASKGFYVLHYSAEESEYPKHIKEFEKLVKSFKGKM